MKAPHSAPPTTGAGATPCSQHKDSLVCQDQRTNDEFLRACTACHNIAKWIKASDDRVQKLLAMMVLMIAAGLLQGVPKGPILPPETRFLFNLVMMERMLELIAALEKMAAEFVFGTLLDTAGKPNNVAIEFSDLTLELSVVKHDVADIVALFKPLLEVSTRMGSSATYTTSLPQRVFMHLLTGALAFKETAAGKRIPSIVETFINSLFERLSSIATIEMACAAVPSPMPATCKLASKEAYAAFRLTKAWRRRLAADDRAHATAFLDVAMNDFFAGDGGKRDPS